MSQLMQLLSQSVKSLAQTVVDGGGKRVEPTVVWTAALLNHCGGNNALFCLSCRSIAGSGLQVARFRGERGNGSLGGDVGHLPNGNEQKISLDRGKL